MQRIIAMTLAIACCLSLFGCKKQEKPLPTEVTTEATTQAPTQAPTEETTEETAAPTKAPTKPSKATTAATNAINKRPPAPTKATGSVTKATNAPTEATAATQAPATEETQVHTHSFGEWIFQAASSCTAAGREDRRCSECGFTESRELPLEEHDLRDTNVCRSCGKVFFDGDAALVELGVACDAWYGAGNVANYAWDIKIWNGKVYRGAGDYDKNSGSTPFFAYNIATGVWERTGVAADEAIHGFEEIGGTLVAPGIDARESWAMGNFYVLQEDGKWKQVRNLKNGIHNFDMIEQDGKIFAGLGTHKVGETVAMSTDGGKTFSFVPLYKDGAPMDLSDYQDSRTYEFIKHNDDVYALIWFKLSLGDVYNLFRYEDGKLVYVENGYPLSRGFGVSRKYIVGNLDFNGACYVTTGSLYAITDFSKPMAYPVIPMPKGETVVDALAKDGIMYVLTFSQIKNSTTQKIEGYKTVIYKSTTGKEGSFEEAVSFDYASKPLSFDFDGEHFYIGTGASVDNAKVGMVLRAKP